MANVSRKPALACTLLVLAFLVVRIVLLQEPWNSDDLSYIEMARQLNAGEHVIQRAALPEHVSHADLRFGLLLPVALAIRICGDNILAYYVFPLLFGLAGFLLMMKITAEVLPRSAVLAAAVLHLVCPFETRHSSVLVADLPAACLTLLYIYYIYKRPMDELIPGELVRRSFVGSLIVFWAYLMRDNQAVLLLPALAVLLAYRRYRLTVAGSMALFLAWVLLEQWLYTTKGAPFGFRWKVLAIGQQSYMEYLPKYTPSQYLVRSFRFIVVDIGWFGLVAFVCAIASHVYGLIVSKNALVRACLAAGLVTYVLFTFYVYGSANGRLIVMTSQHRFVQLFYYTSILAIGVSVAHLAPRLRARLPDPRTFRAAAGALFSLALISFAVAAHAHPGRLLSAGSDLWASLAALDAELGPAPRATATLTGTEHSLRVMKLFPRTVGGLPLAYRIVSNQELLVGLTTGQVEWSLVDRKREERDLGYLKGEERAHREALLRQTDERLEQEHRLLFRGRSLELYRLKSAPSGG